MSIYSKLHLKLKDPLDYQDFYEIFKFTIDYTIRKAKERRKQQAYLESELKKLENNLESSENLRKYES